MHYCFKQMNKEIILNRSIYNLQVTASPSFTCICIQSFYLTHVVGHVLLLFQFALSLGPSVLVQFSVLWLILCFYLFYLFKAGAGNGFLQLTDMHHI
jgi:hypothetical protein